MTNRRRFLQVSGLVGAGVITGLASCASPKYLDRHFIASNKFRKFPRLDVSLDRVVKETVGLRPFRKKGFRVEKQELGNKIIVHNYGHGGSGWSLSWGTGRLAVDLAAVTGERKYAVMGSGVVGISTARLLQEQGYDVTIYTKVLPPHVTSSKATGTWSPSYRLIESEFLTPGFEERWKKAAAYSFKTYQNLLGLGDIVTWMDNYHVTPHGSASGGGQSGGHLAQLDIPGLLPEREVLDKKTHPFAADGVVKDTSMVFNIPSYLTKHLSDFVMYGGKVIIRDFKSLEEVDALPEKCIINCTGLGSMALFNDEDMMPVAGQLSFLIPQPAFNYRLTTPDGYAIPRKDGIVLGGNAIEGSWDETPDRTQTEKVVSALQQVMDQLRA